MEKNLARIATKLDLKDFPTEFWADPVAAEHMIDCGIWQPSAGFVVFQFDGENIVFFIPDCLRSEFEVPRCGAETLTDLFDAEEFNGKAEKVLKDLYDERMERLIETIKSYIKMSIDELSTLLEEKKANFYAQEVFILRSLSPILLAKEAIFGGNFLASAIMKAKSPKEFRADQDEVV